MAARIDNVPSVLAGRRASQFRRPLEQVADQLPFDIGHVCAVALAFIRR
jgi:hypothetical protein